jgi:hypothetical protein
VEFPVLPSPKIGGLDIALLFRMANRERTKDAEPGPGEPGDRHEDSE